MDGGVGRSVVGELALMLSTCYATHSLLRASLLPHAKEQLWRVRERAKESSVVLKGAPRLQTDA